MAEILEGSRIHDGEIDARRFWIFDFDPGFRRT
jgi:hypothetical protein